MSEIQPPINRKSIQIIGGLVVVRGGNDTLNVEAGGVVAGARATIGKYDMGID